MARKRFSEREVVGICIRQIDVRLTDDAYEGQYWEGHIICPECDKPIMLAEVPQMERDHFQPLGLGGDDTPKNAQMIHGHCHKRKTHTEDRPRMNKADRQAGKKGQRARRERRGSSSIQGRGFETNKDGKWKAKINARTEPRT